MAHYQIIGDPNPDCTTSDTGDVAGTHNGQPYWSWTNDAGTWYLYYTTSPSFDPCWLISNALSNWLTEGGGGGELGWYGGSGTGLNRIGDYNNTGGGASGTPTVAGIPAFTINSATGEITIIDPDGLDGDQTWELLVRVADADSLTAEGTITINTQYGWFIEAVSELAGFSQITNLNVELATNTVSQLGSFSQIVDINVLLAIDAISQLGSFSQRSIIQSSGPFAVNSETGELTVAHPMFLETGQTWEVVVRVTDSDENTDEGIFTILLTSPREIDAISQLGSFSQVAILSGLIRGSIFESNIIQPAGGGLEIISVARSRIIKAR